MQAPKFIEPDIITIPEGGFLMGSENGAANEQPVHRVWVDTFGIARYPVTNREYKTLYGDDRPSTAAVLG